MEDAADTYKEYVAVAYATFSPSGDGYYRNISRMVFQKIHDVKAEEEQSSRGAAPDWWAMEKTADARNILYCMQSW